MIIQGNSLSIPLKNESVHCVITSPPYWGLRDYGVGGQLGLEKTPEEYVENMVKVFREVKRVLRDDGTLWLNLGDSYGGYWGDKYAHKPFGKDRTPDESTPPNKPSQGKMAKNLMGVPWRVAFALQADGWYLRSDIIWSKPNPMPESVTDRPTKAHEYVFLLTKSQRYYFDQEAVREKAIEGMDLGLLRGKSFADSKFVSAHAPSILARQQAGIDSRTAGNGFRNLRTVWEIPTQGFSGAHFATFPEELVRKCLFAGCPVGGVVFDPFLGSGTVGVVAQKYNRKWVGTEIKPDYCKMAKKRTINTNIAMI